MLVNLSNFSKSFLGFSQLYLISAKSFDIWEICTKQVYYKDASFGDICIKDAFVKATCTENICAGGASIVKHLGTHLQFFWILEVKLFKTGLEIRIKVG